MNVQLYSAIRSLAPKMTKAAAEMWTTNIEETTKNVETKLIAAYANPKKGKPQNLKINHADVMMFVIDEIQRGGIITAIGVPKKAVHRYINHIAAEGPLPPSQQEVAAADLKRQQEIAANTAAKLKADTEKKAAADKIAADKKKAADDLAAYKKAKPYMFLKWGDMKAFARDKGMEITGKTKKEDVEKFLEKL